MWSGFRTGVHVELYDLSYKYLNFLQVEIFKYNFSVLNLQFFVDFTFKKISAIRPALAWTHEIGRESKCLPLWCMEKERGASSRKVFPS